MANPTAPTNVPEYLKRYKVYLLVAKFVRILFYVCVASCFAWFLFFNALVCWESLFFWIDIQKFCYKPACTRKIRLNLTPFVPGYRSVILYGYILGASIDPFPSSHPRDDADVKKYSNFKCSRQRTILNDASWLSAASTTTLQLQPLYLHI